MSDFFSINYEEILNEFGEENIAKRFRNLFDNANHLIDSFSIRKYVKLDNNILDELILDYFTDIYRLKIFHGIKLINSAKISGYLAFWIVKRKPIQVISDPEDKDSKKAISLINETFALKTLLHFAFDMEIILLKDAKDLQEWKELIDNLLYTFKYRSFTSGHLESVILSIYSNPIYPKIINCD